MQRFCVFLVLAVSPAHRMLAQACRSAQAINDTSRVVRLLKESFQRDSATSADAGHSLRALDSTAIPTLLAAMCGDRKNPATFPIRVRAGGVLTRLGPPGVRALIRTLADSDDAVADNALAALSFPDENPGDRTPDVLRLFDDSRPSVRRRAVELVMLTGPARTEAIAVMARSLADPDSALRASAAARLAFLGPQSAPLTPNLITMLADRTPRVRQAAAWALGRTGTSSTAVVTALIRTLLKDRVPEVRAAAASALGSLRAGAPTGRDTILASLSRTLSDPDSIVRRSTAHALREIGAPAAALQIQGLRNGDPAVRITAARALGEGLPTSSAIDALIPAFGDQDPQVREEVVSALGGFGPLVAERMQTLRNGPDPVAQGLAVRVLEYLQDVDRLPVADACFELRRAAWQPQLEIGIDTIFSTPPGTVRFSRVQNSGFLARDEQRSYRVLPANGASMYVDGPGFWSPISGVDSLSIVWTNGFSGVRLKLGVSGDTLRGVAETFWDFGRTPQTALMTGVHVPCR